MPSIRTSNARSDCGFLFFGTISSVLGDESTPYINQITPAINSEDENANSISADNLFKVNSAIVVEQEIAVDTIGTVFATTG